MNENKKNTTKGNKQDKPLKKPRKKIPYLGRTIFAGFLIFCTLAAITVGIFGLTYVNQVLAKVDLNSLNDFSTENSTKIYDKDGELIADLGAKTIEVATYDELPQVVVDALISIEDSRFFEHNGFDIPRFLKAMLNNAACLCFNEGGSTLTMQVIKNNLFVDDETGQQAAGGLDGISRKITEIYLAPQLESIYSKQDIIALYLNSSNYGVSNSRGIVTAAKELFGKEVSHLTLSEAAYLVGVINEPGANNPFFNYDGVIGYLDYATERRDTVLSLMLSHGYINETDYELAVSIKLEDLFIDQGVNDEVATARAKNQAYIDAVVTEVKEITGKDPYEVPMNIYTYLDQEVQELMEDIANDKYRTSNDKYSITSAQEVSWDNDGDLQTASIVINNSTGAIIATTGGRNYVGSNLFQRAFNAITPGSTAKAFLPYLLAFENIGLSTADSVMDTPYTYAGTSIPLFDWDKTFKGQVSLDYAIGDSRNVPAVLMYDYVEDKIGHQAIADYLIELGVDPSIANETHNQYAIGGDTFEISPANVANAYQMILNGGNYINAHTVSKIEYHDGTDTYVPDVTSKQLVSAGSAYLMASMLKEVVDGRYATATAPLIKNYPVFAKTGTSTFEDGSNKNRWIVAGTSEFITATYVGYDEIESLSASQSSYNHSGRTASAILDKLQSIYGTPGSLSQPSDVSKISFIKGTSNFDTTTNTITHAQSVEGMNSSMLTSGLIRSKFAALTTLTDDLKPTALDDSKVNVSVTSSGGKNTISVSVPAYADADMLVKNDGVMKMDGGYTGTWQFHKTWLYGPIRYYVTIMDGTTEVATFKSDKETFTSDFTLSSYSGNLKAVVYYAYEDNATIRSNEVSKSITVSDTSVTIPSFNDGTYKKSDFESFASANGITHITYSSVSTNDASLDGYIAEVTPNLDGLSVLGSQLVNTTFKVTIYQYQN